MVSTRSKKQFDAKIAEQLYIGFYAIELNIYLYLVTDPNKC